MIGDSGPALRFGDWKLGIGSGFVTSQTKLVRDALKNGLRTLSNLQMISSLSTLDDISKWELVQTIDILEFDFYPKTDILYIVNPILRGINSKVVKS